MKRRISRFAVGIVAGWVIAVLAPGAVLGLAVYQFNVRRIAPAVPTLVFGVRAEVTVIDADVVHITPVMRATVVAAFEAPPVPMAHSVDPAVPLREAPPAISAMPTSSARTAVAIGAMYWPASVPTSFATMEPSPTLTGAPLATLTPLPLDIGPTETPEPIIQPLPTPSPIETPTHLPTIAATNTLAPTVAPMDTWTPVPTSAPTQTATVSPVPIPTDTPTSSPLESPLATPTPLPTAVETETPTP